MGKYVCTHTHWLRCTRGTYKVTLMHRFSVRFTETQACRQRQRNTWTNTHVDAQRYWHRSLYRYVYTDLHTWTHSTWMDTETHKYTWTNTEAHGNTSMHICAHRHRKVCTHTGRAQHTFTDTQLHRHVCVLPYVRMQTEVGIGSTEAYINQEEQRHSRTHWEDSRTQNPQMHTVA